MKLNENEKATHTRTHTLKHTQLDEYLFLNKMQSVHAQSNDITQYSNKTKIKPFNVVLRRTMNQQYITELI